MSSINILTTEISLRREVSEINVSYFQMHYWNVVHNYSEVIKCMAYKYMITTLNDLYVKIVQHFIQTWGKLHYAIY